MFLEVKVNSYKVLEVCILLICSHTTVDVLASKMVVSLQINALVTMVSRDHGVDPWFLPTALLVKPAG